MPWRRASALALVLWTGCGGGNNADRYLIDLEAHDEMARPQYALLSWFGGRRAVIDERVPATGQFPASGKKLGTVVVEIDPSLGGDRMVIVRGLRNGTELVSSAQATLSLSAGASRRAVLVLAASLADARDPAPDAGARPPDTMAPVADATSLEAAPTPDAATVPDLSPDITPVPDATSAPDKSAPDTSAPDLSADQRKDPPAGLVGYWSFEDNLGPWKDSSGYANDGTKGNSPYTQGDVPVTNFPNTTSARFNSSDDDYIRVPRTATLEPRAVTVSFWVKRDGSSTLWAEVVDKTYKNNGGPYYISYAVALKPGDWSQVNWETTGHNLASPTGSVPDLTWTHIAGTYDPDGEAPQKRLYINGALVASATRTTAIVYDATRTGDLYFSADSATGTGSSLNGSADDIRIYNRALTAAEVASLAAGN
jgi:hypothetical protein